MLKKIKSIKNRKIFQNIYNNNGFKGKDSISGPGSDLEQTRLVRQELSRLLKELEIKTFLDLPCGDFFWMKFVDFKGTLYIGADIIESLVRKNENEFGSERRKFQVSDVVNDPLPSADMLFCRDCLVHLSFNDIYSAVNNMKKSQIRYLLTTSFIDRNQNVNIKTGEWRPLNLLRPPFNFPEPIKIITENCTENNGIYRDKSLLLWKIKDLPDF